MQTKYIIEVSENANIAEIAGKIGTALQKQKLLENKQTAKQIGNVLEVIPPEISITVTRKIPKHADLLKCIICGTEYPQEAAFNYYSNYGGVKTKKHVCSKECFAPIKELFGDRVAAKGKKLTPAIVYRYDGIKFSPLKANNATLTTDNTVTLKKEDSDWIWLKGGKPYTPTHKDMQAIEFILKLTKQ